MEIKVYKDVKIEYVNTKENPADVATRGTSPKELSNNQLWWNGPTWIRQNPIDWSLTKSDISLLAPNSDEENTGNNISLSVKNNENTPSTPKPPFDIDINRYSSVTKLLRVTAI